MNLQRTALSCVAVWALIIPIQAHATATLIIQNDDASGTGFNDPTPAQPTGGNAGTTIGQQRLIAFKYAAVIWGSALNSSVTIRISSKWDIDPTQLCDATSGVLGSAAPSYVLAGAFQYPNLWYPEALGDALSGTDHQPGNPAINTHFNSYVGGANCLNGTSWYYGLDGNVQSAQLDLVAIVLHEFAHGLGFFTTTNGQDGTLLQSRSSIFDHYLYDLTAAAHWDQMTNSQRVTSAINTRKLVWDGQYATAQVPNVPLQLGTATLTVNNVPPLNELLVGTASFGPPITTTTNITGDLQVPSPDNFACNPPSGSLSGKVALIDRGPAGSACAFVQKVKNAQNAGAVGVVMVNNVPGSPPPEMGGNDPTITIPSVHITQADGTTLKNHVGPVSVTLRALNIYAGADFSNHPLLYTPNPYRAGSSIPHNDTITRPHLLMEPDYSTSLGHNLDLTGYFLKDIGWVVPAPNPSTNLSADVAITVTASGFRAGGNVTYVVNVKNNGPTTAVDTQVVNTAPSGITFSSNSGDCSTNFPCMLGDIPSGSSKSFTSKFTVPVSYTNNSITSTFNAAAAIPDPNTTNNSATANSTLGGSSGGGCASATGHVGLALLASILAISFALGRRRARVRA